MKKANSQSIKMRSSIWLVLILAGVYSQFGCADDSGVDFFTLTMENDIIAGEDGGYTNGLAVSWANGPFDTFSEENTPGWLRFLSGGIYISTMPNKRRAVSYMIAQGMQTATDIEKEELTVDEPPYAGLLAWKGTLHAFDEKVSDKISLTLGMVGPASGAEKAQKFVHDITSSDEPQGWHHQISNEVVLRIAAERSWRLFDVGLGSNVEMDLIGTVLAGAGNLRSDAGGALSLRFGRGLGRTFPTATTLPGREINPLAGMPMKSWTVFVNLLGRYVANSISIDGNTWEDSHSVKLKHEQATIAYGGSMNFGKWAFLVSAARSSDAYEGQSGPAKFGSFSVSYRY